MKVLISSDTPLLVTVLKHEDRNWNPSGYVAVPGDGTPTPVEFDDDAALGVKRREPDTLIPALEPFVLYIDRVDGDDANDGTPDHPIKTLMEAAKRIADSPFARDVAVKMV